MNRISSRVFLLLLGLFVLFGSYVQAEEKEIPKWVLGAVGKEVSFTKYIDSRYDFSWNGQMGVNIDILKYKRTGLYLMGNLETVMDKDFEFSPYDINYTIEPGVKWGGKFGTFSAIFHHECHHDVDRFDNFTEMFNIVGVRLEPKKKDIFKKGKKDVEWLWDFNKMMSYGKYVGTRDVNYDWDVVGELEINIMRHKKKVPYVRLNTHMVTQTSNNPSGKRYFVNYTIEPGIKLRGPNGILSFFCQLWRKHDIDRCNGQTDNFALAGARYEW